MGKTIRLPVKPNMRKTPFVCVVVCAALAGALHAQETAKPKSLMAAFAVAELPCDNVETCHKATAEGSPEDREKAAAKLLTFGKDGVAALAELSASAAFSRT